MPADALHYAALSKELNSLLSGGRIDKIIMPDKTTVLLTVRASGANRNLIITAAAQPRCYLTAQKPAAAATPPAFCLHLRKHIGGGIITCVSALPFERILRFDIKSFGDLGEPRERIMFVEIMGKYSNIVITDGAGKITDALKHISADEGRPILPGVIFAPPAVAEITPADTDKINQITAGITEPNEIAALLMRTVRGIAPATAKEAATPPGSIGENLLSIIKAEIMPMLYRAGGKAVDFSYFEYSGIAGERTNFPCISEAMDAYYTERENSENKEGAKMQLLRTVSAAIEKQKKKLGLILQEKENASDYESERITGELITANLYKIKPGDKAVTVDDWYTGEQRVITLSCGTGAEDAEKKFARYRKKKRTLEHLEKQLAEAVSLSEYYESVAANIENADSPADLEDMRSELEDAGLITARKVTGKADTSKPRVYSVGGYELTIGKNNMQNDRITKAAKGEDIWLHTQGIHGSHVILKFGKKEPDIEVIKKAAGYAAFFSKARFSENVPVDYTKIKNVRKPKGFPPGKVEYVNQKTLYVTPIAPDIN